MLLFMLIKEGIIFFKFENFLTHDDQTMVN